MKGRDVVNWIVLNKDYTIPIAALFAGWLLGKVL